MDHLYRAVFNEEEERWGFWCEPLYEFAIIERAGRGDKPVGASAPPEKKVIKIKAPFGNRRATNDVPRLLRFFTLNPPPEGFSESWLIDWVGHVRCWPDSEKRSEMLEVCDGDIIIASGPIPRSQGRSIWISVVELPGRLILPITCCG